MSLNMPYKKMFLMIKYQEIINLSNTVPVHETRVKFAVQVFVFYDHREIKIRSIVSVEYQSKEKKPITIAFMLLGSKYSEKICTFTK